VDWWTPRSVPKTKDSGREFSQRVSEFKRFQKRLSHEKARRSIVGDGVPGQENLPDKQ